MCLAWIYERAPATLYAVDDQGWTCAHAAAVHGHGSVLQYIYTVAPETLIAEDDAKRVPADYGATCPPGTREEIWAVLADLGADIPVPKPKE